MVVLSSLLGGAHGTTSPTLTAVKSARARRLCCPTQVFPERKMLLSSRFVLWTRPFEQVILAAKAHN